MTQVKHLCRFYKQDDLPWVWMQSGYNADFIELFKDLVPADSRMWDPTVRMWALLNHEALRKTMTIAEAYYTQIIIEDSAKRWLGSEGYQGRSTPPPEINLYDVIGTPFDVLYLKPNAPPEVVDAAYRALAKKHHPDLGGNTRLMQEINKAYEKIKGRR